MTPTRFQIDDNGARLLQDKQVFGHAWLTGAHGGYDVPTCRRAVRRKVSEDLVAGPVAKGRDSGLDVGGPFVVVRLGNPGHVTILIERAQKSKTRSLDDTLFIFDNSLHSLLAFAVRADCRGHT